MALLGRIQLTGGTPRDQCIDLSHCKYIGPAAAAIPMSNSLAAEHAGYKYSVIFPASGKSESFACFAGLLRHFGVADLPPANHPRNVTVPLTTVQHPTWGAEDPVINLARRLATLNEDDELYPRNSLLELIQNVDDHSRSPFGAIYCARFLNKVNTIRVALVDRGVGIASTPRSVHPQVRDAEHALELVVRGGITRRSGRHNAGVGICNLRNQVTRQLHGEIVVVTEDGVAYGDRGGNLRTCPLGTRFGGTGVFFTVPVAR